MCQCEVRGWTVEFASVGGVRIGYERVGSGRPVVLSGGMGMPPGAWEFSGLRGALVDAGFEVVTYTARGVAPSDAPPAPYTVADLAGDLAGLMDHLGIERADVMGYSMGARITAFLAHRHPERTRAIVLGGLGMHLVEGVGLPESIAEALEAPSLADVGDPQGRMFRAFADQTRSDRRALAACIRGSRQTLSRAEVAAIRAPALVAVGTRDPIAGSAEQLAALMPRARPLPIPDRDHMLAVGDKVFKAGVLRFLQERP